VLRNVQFILFKLEDAAFAVDASTVVRVGAPNPDFQDGSVPEPPDALRSVGTSETPERGAGRGIDLRRVLFGRAHDPGACQTLVGLVGGGTVLELLVGEVSDIIDLRGEDIFPVPKSIFAKHASLFRGVFRHQGSLVPVLCMEELARLKEYRV
jgi:chemotaxis signal transduction protein